MKRRFICIVCPNGCEIEAEVENSEVISVTGNICRRGEQYVRQELTAPRRTIASSVFVKDGELPLASVRLTKAIPREMIFPVMDEIHKVVLTAPVQAGTIVLHNVCGLDSDVMVTKNVKATCECDVVHRPSVLTCSETFENIPTLKSKNSRQMPWIRE